MQPAELRGVNSRQDLHRCLLRDSPAHTEEVGTGGENALGTSTLNCSCGGLDHGMTPKAKWETPRLISLQAVYCQVR